MLTNDVVSFEQPGPEMKIAEFANSVDHDEVAQDKPPHQHHIRAVTIQLNHTTIYCNVRHSYCNTYHIIIVFIKEC